MGSTESAGGRRIAVERQKRRQGNRNEKRKNEQWKTQEEGEEEEGEKEATEEPLTGVCNNSSQKRYSHNPPPKPVVSGS